MADMIIVNIVDRYQILKAAQLLNSIKLELFDSGISIPRRPHISIILFIKSELAYTHPISTKRIYYHDTVILIKSIHRT